MKIRKRIIVDSIFGILLGVSIISLFFIHFTQNNLLETLKNKLIAFQLFFKNNYISLIISIVLSIFVVLILKKIRKSKNTIIFFPKIEIVNIFIPLTILMTLIIIQQQPFYPLLLIMPIIFVLIILQGLTEYYKIIEETLYVYKGLFSRIKAKINIHEIISIGTRIDNSGEGTEKFITIKYTDNNFIELRDGIENRDNFIKKILSINSNISINVYDKIKVHKGQIIVGENIYNKLLNEEKPKIIWRVIMGLFLIFLYTLDLYMIIKLIIRKWHVA